MWSGVGGKAWMWVHVRWALRGAGGCRRSTWTRVDVGGHRGMRVDIAGCGLRQLQVGGWVPGLCLVMLEEEGGAGGGGH